MTIRNQARVLLAALAALAVLAVAVGAQAQDVDIDSVQMNDLSNGEWGDTISPEPDCGGILGACPGIFFDDPSAVSVPNGWNGWNSEGNQVVPVGGNAFSTDHDYYLATQAQNAITTALYYNGRVQYEVDIDAIGPDEEWELTINAANTGSVTHTDANAGFVEIADSTSFASLSAISRSSQSATGDAVFSALTNNGGQNFNDTGGSYNRTGSFTVTGSGDQTIFFTLLFEINTDIDGMLSFGSGDSMCFNGGLGGTPNVACGVGGGTGLVVSGSIVQTAPEPTTMLLGAFGLLGLGAMGRKTRKTL